MPQITRHIAEIDPMQMHIGGYYESIVHRAIAELRRAIPTDADIVNIEHRFTHHPAKIAQILDIRITWQSSLHRPNSGIYPQFNSF